jgi:mitochondrial import inner membrane translocase subunit TIM23
MSSAPENQNTPTASGSGSNDPTIFLRNARFSMNQGPATQTESVTASDVLGGAFDPTKLHPMAGLSDQLDYLNLEDDKTNELPGATTALPSRGWSDDLCYGTGTTYLSGEHAICIRCALV